MSEVKHPIKFLIVEDDDVDMMSIKRAFKHIRLNNPVVRAKDGREAIDLLHNTDNESRLSSPYIIFLDLNMPRMNGLEFLKVLRGDPRTEHARVFVLTTSETDEDIINAHAFDILGYIFKSDLMGSLSEAITALEEDWVLLA